MNTLRKTQDPNRLIEPQVRGIANALLSRAGAAIMSGDFDEMVCCFNLPTVVETFEGKNVLTTEDDLRAVYSGMRKHLVRKSVTEMIRNVLSAEFRDDTTIQTTHESRLMNGTRLVQEPYPCFSIVRRFDNRWKITFSSYAIVNSPKHVDVLLSKAQSQDNHAS